MGASSLMQWLAWTVYYMVLCAIIAYLLTIVVTSKWLAEKSFQYTWSGAENLELYFDNNTEKYRTFTIDMIAYLKSRASNVNFQTRCIMTVWKK